VVEPVEPATTVITCDADPVAKPNGNPCPRTTTEVGLGVDELAGRTVTDVRAAGFTDADRVMLEALDAATEDGGRLELGDAPSANWSMAPAPLGIAGIEESAVTVGAALLTALGREFEAMPATTTTPAATARTAAEVESTGATRM
jgi:hypothetical protein